MVCQEAPMHTSPLQPPGIGSFAYWRFELFFKNEEQLVDATKFMLQHRITRMNLTNKVLTALDSGQAL